MQRVVKQRWRIIEAITADWKLQLLVFRLQRHSHCQGFENLHSGACEFIVESPQPALGSVKDCRGNLRASPSSEDFEEVEGICKRSAESPFKKFKERQMLRFDNLRKQIIGINNKPDDVKLRLPLVVNLSNHKLSTTEEAVLTNGPKYAVTPKINLIDIAAPIEAGLQISLAKDQEKLLARVKISDAVRKGKKPTNNFTAEERKAFQELKKNGDIQILHADKGNATVVLNAAD